MIDIPKNRTLSLLGSAMALRVALIVLCVACAVVAVVFPDLRFAHAWSPPHLVGAKPVPTISPEPS